MQKKLQTILIRGIANTRLRDFYDVYELVDKYENEIVSSAMQQAFIATCRKRKTEFEQAEAEEILTEIRKDDGLADMWIRYKEKNYYVEDLAWEDILVKVAEVIRNCY